MAQTTDGFPIHVFAEDWIGRHLLMSGKFDRSNIQLLLDRAEPGDTLLDIGANIGYYSAVFLANVPNGRAVCFEPQPGVVDLLTKNMAQFEERASVMPVGLAEQDGELRFAVNEENRGASRISPEGNVLVKVRQASSALGDLDRVDLLKIDVEGFEEAILRNAEGELARLQPRAILVEDQTGALAPDGAIGAILTRLGYEIFGIRKQLLKTDLTPIRTREDCRYNDYLALREREKG
ncbi:FkbM family methyltransferase [Erythrobacter sp. THAF29]|uniref:FkbM family methyltransferase n=1 Tax=Erythrobacter sp. THAF29 TaxID=2587851 RepID=UPI0015620A36|nr:FkbM family methyltransferase [Erythrobacter sp. THAF29]